VTIVLTDELVRRGGKREAVLAALRAAGPGGVLNTDLMKPDVGGSRAGGRVDELREQGHDISCDPVTPSRGIYRYTLHVPARIKPGTSGYLASLPTVDNTTEPPADPDRLF
jgi:hypothetical protein